MAETRGICPQVVWQHAHSSAQITVRDEENIIFSLNIVYELYNDNKPCPRPPSPHRGTRIKKKGFVAPILKFPSAEISKTRNMLSKHGTTKVKIR